MLGANSVTESLAARAEPAKQFFVSMITRDISFEDTILDLIDNSVDSALKREGSPCIGLADGVDLSAYSIQIIANQSGFSIADNCGGMELTDAVEYAFNFGRRHGRGWIRTRSVCMGLA